MRQVISKIGTLLLYVFAFLLPWQTRWIFFEDKLNNNFWEYGSFSLYAFDIILLLLLIVSLIIAKKSNLKLNSQIVSVLLFLCAALFSLYWALDKELGFYSFIRLLLACSLIFIVSQINFRLIYLFIVIAFSGMVQSCLGIWQFLQQKAFAFKWLGLAAHSPWILGDTVVEFTSGRWLRAYGAFPHPNILGGFLAIAIILSFGIYLAANKNWQKYFALASVVINSAGLFFTFSRSAWLGLAVSLLFFGLLSFWIFHKREISFLKLLTALFLPFIIFTLIYPNLILTRFEATERLEHVSYDERALYQEQSLKLIRNNWPTGIGIGNYTLAVHDKIDKTLKTEKYQPVHNIYLLIFTELGIFGLIFFIFLLGSLFKNIDYKNYYSLSLGSCFIFIACVGFFDHYFWTISSSLFLFFLLIGLSANFPRIIGKK